METQIDCKLALLSLESKKRLREAGKNDEKGTRNILKRLRRRLRDRAHLVDTIPFSILSQSLLRSLGAKLLPLFRRLPRRHAVRVLPFSKQRTVP